MAEELILPAFQESAGCPTVLRASFPDVAIAGVPQQDKSP